MSKVKTLLYAIDYINALDHLLRECVPYCDWVSYINIEVSSDNPSFLHKCRYSKRVPRLTTGNADLTILTCDILLPPPTKSSHFFSSAICITIFDIY